MDLTFVVPVLNEAAYLPATLDSLREQELHGIEAEVLVLDGGSTDGSRQIVRRYERLSTPSLRFRLVDNPRRRTPAAFNTGIARAQGAFIGLGGAHTLYPPRYFARAVELLRGGVAEVVGGGHDAYLSSVNSPLGRAMASLYLSPMGAGVAAYHRRSTAGFVDTVYGGFYRRDVFERVGSFDETLTRNQDNELNARVVAAGMRIYFDPLLSTSYVLKADLRTFLKRGYLFGRYHPETWSQHPEAFRWRHAIPGLFVLYLVAAIVASILGFAKFALVPLGVYVALLCLAAARLARKQPVAVSILAIPLFAAYHISYGSGTVAGFGRRALRGPLRSKTRAEARRSGITR